EILERYFNNSLNTDKEFLNLFKPYGVKGFEKLRVGAKGDSGYVMFDSYKLNQNKKKIAYSFGISDDVSWDEGMVKKGYDIFMYDHTINSLPHGKENNNKFHFFKEGISSENHPEDSCRPLKEFMEINNHINNEDLELVLKIDVEGAEWNFLQDIDTSILNKFSQILIELHFERNKDLDYYSYCVKKLTENHFIFHVHNNNYTLTPYWRGFPIPIVFELSLANKNLFEKEKNTTLFPDHKLDIIHKKNVPDFALHFPPFLPEK
ncbi:MAG: hypothetical protein QG630_476, partial [Patescibacteria group bacterium]|nr:hypothetical protein [Patescibacteria group bacterium]